MWPFVARRYGYDGLKGVAPVLVSADFARPRETRSFPFIGHCQQEARTLSFPLTGDSSRGRVDALICIHSGRAAVVICHHPNARSRSIC
jgi:hypothetical protein